MSTKIKARGSVTPRDQGKGVNTAAYAALGGRLGYIAGQYVAPELRERFEQDFVNAMQEAVALNAPANALAVLEGFGKGYDQAKVGPAG